MRVILDTSVLVADTAPAGVEAAISVVTITELHFGTLLAADNDERARRVGRLAAVEANENVPGERDLAVVHRGHVRREHALRGAVELQALRMHLVCRETAVTALQWPEARW